MAVSEDFTHVTLFHRSTMAFPALTPILLALLATSATGQSTERSDLYQGDRHVIHLSNVTFYDALLDKPHAWAIEFYKDWCGHCQRYAPVWSEVARRTKGERGVVRKVRKVREER